MVAPKKKGGGAKAGDQELAAVRGVLAKLPPAPQAPQPSQLPPPHVLDRVLADLSQHGPPGVLGGLFLLAERFPDAAKGDSGRPYAEQLAQLLRAADQQYSQETAAGQRRSLVLTWLRAAGWSLAAEASGSSSEDRAATLEHVLELLEDVDFAASLKAWQKEWADPKVDHPDAAALEGVTSEQLAMIVLWQVCRLRNAAAKAVAKSSGAGVRMSEADKAAIFGICERSNEVGGPCAGTAPLA